MLVDEIAQHVAIAVEQILKRAQAKVFQRFLADLPFNAPDVFCLLLPKEMHPIFLAGFFDLVGLVVDPKDDLITAKGEGLYLAVFAVLAVWTCPVSTDGLKVLDLLGIFNQIDLTVAVN